MRENKETQLSCDYEWLTSKQYAKDEAGFVNCPFCKSNDYKTIAVERTVLGVVRCKICGLIYVNPWLKSPEKIYWGDSNGYYEEARFISERLSGNLKD